MIQENVMWETWIGMKVIKRSNKPFKSTQKIGVVTEYTINPYSNKKGFKIDNDTIVDCHQVKLILE
jgi:hypothetical protein